MQHGLRNGGTKDIHVYGIPHIESLVFVGRMLWAVVFAVR